MKKKVSAKSTKKEEILDLVKLNTNTQTVKTRALITPKIALTLLKNGNKRFVSNKPLNRDLLKQVKDTSGKGGQKPYATVLSCIDSRVSSELIFDQGIGDIFSIRIAGNFVNTDILGSMEFACKAAGTKLIVVLGHTSCGAVGGACNDVQIGNLGSLLGKIRPAVNAIVQPKNPKQRTAENKDFVNVVATKNVKLNIQRILNESTILAQMVADGDIMVVGGMYDIATGKVKING